MNLLLLTYNNYFNRIVKKEATLLGYSTAASPNYKHILGVNFVPNDGITTEQIINWSESFNPDYLVVYDENNTIVSRWFVNTQTRTRNGQFKLSLKRDLIVDFYDDVVQAPCFIEKASLGANNPLIFNSEGMTYNQIKTSESLLKDKTGLCWLVGYYDKSKKADMHGNVETNSLGIQVDTTLTNIQSYSFWNYCTDNTGGTMMRKGSQEATKYLIDIKPLNPTLLSPAFEVSLDSACNYEIHYSHTGAENSTLICSSEDFLENINTFEANFKRAKLPSRMWGEADRYYSTEDANIQNLVAEDGKIIYITGEQKYYRVHLLKNTAAHQRMPVRELEESDLWNMMSYGVENDSFITGTPNDHSFIVYFGFTAYQLQLEDITAAVATWDLSANTIVTEDSPYNIFCIPYRTDSDTIKLKISGNIVNINSSNCLATIMSISREMTTGSSGVLYDIQILPYCPLVEILGGDTGSASCDIDLDSIDASYKSYVMESNIVKSVILVAPKSKFNFKIPYSISIPTTSIDMKLDSETDMYRLCSPNWSTSFEFNPAKNNGVTYFDIDCTYKPYNPYIHVNPDFGGLYGNDYDDARGLILGGDFGLPIITDNWEVYERDNVNYQNSFDRQIEHLEFSNHMSNVQQAIGAISSAGTKGLATGAVSGSVAGGLLAGSASLLGGVADFAMTIASQREQIQYSKDQFNYSLGNIQALPLSLTRVGALNNNNKIFPVLEYYTCTNTEKQALRNKIKYNGMTVMTIGTISEYLDPEEKTFIQGQIIRLSNIKENYFIATEIYNEIARGVYI